MKVTHLSNNLFRFSINKGVWATGRVVNGSITNLSGPRKGVDALQFSLSRSDAGWAEMQVVEACRKAVKTGKPQTAL